MSPAAPPIPLESLTAQPARHRRRARRDVELDERQRGFLRMVSHELRTPLNSILGFSEIISQELYGPLGAPQYKEYAEIIQSSGQRLLSLVNQVLEIARLDGRAADLDLGREPLEHALDDVLEGLRDDILQRQATIRVLPSDDLPCVIADGRGLRSVPALPAGLLRPQWIRQTIVPLASRYTHPERADRPRLLSSCD